jgi:CRISPR/Cas system CSM-associated protein Csm3 (group 7 of RAMP superfamily)
MNQRLTRRQQRLVQKRIIIRGVLELETPTCLSSGDAEADTDLPLLRDTIENKALLLGSSIAGALRSYLESHMSDTQLFGGNRRQDQGAQSPLMVEDALSQQVMATELRDGVKIDAATGTASDKAKYDLELLQAGTNFDLGFELLVNQETEKQLKQELAIALNGLEKGHIPLGMKKRRGFGQCHVKQWQVWEFNLTNDIERQAWLLFEHQQRFLHANVRIHENIANAFGITTTNHQPAQTCSIEATFTLASPLLIRSGQHDQSKAPDVVHLKSKRSNGSQPIISGTSLAGVLRHRAVKIINTLGLDESIAQEIFGYEPDYAKKQSATKQGKASRLTVGESVIENAEELVQNRIAIDRFTGGALDGALFSEQPVCPSPQTQVKLKFQLKQATDSEVGLLLLLLKELWTGDLSIGGGRSIGRGRLQGKSATISYSGTSYKICQDQSDQPLTIDNPDALEAFVTAFALQKSQELST